MINELKYKLTIYPVTDLDITACKEMQFDTLSEIKAA